MHLVITIPAYNEEKSVGEVIDRIKKLELPGKVTILVIDDCSTDNTGKVAEEHGAIVHRNKKNLGLGLTMQKAINEALRLNPDVIVNIDADGQYRPEDIPVLLGPILKGEADFVLGNRFGDIRYEMPVIKKIGNKAFSFLVRIISGEDIKDAQTGFRAFTRDVAETLALTLKSHYTYTQEMIIHAAMNDFVTVEMPITFEKRKYGESRLISNPFSYAWRTMMILFRTFRDYEPLIVFSGLGGLIFIIGFILGLYVLSLYLEYGSVTRKPTMVLSVLLCLLGAQLFMFGFLADMIKTMRAEILSLSKFKK